MIIFTQGILFAFSIVFLFLTAKSFLNTRNKKFSSFIIPNRLNAISKENNNTNNFSNSEDLVINVKNPKQSYRFSIIKLSTYENMFKY